jgi:two-component system NtrC family response regulator
MNKPILLIIDDETSQRKILRGFLEKKGYRVLEASSGNEGVGLAAANHIDIILTDFKMPDITGEVVLEKVKNINPEISVVIITAFGTIENAVRAMKKGAYDYITKPIDLDELEITLERLSEHRQLIDENVLLKKELAERQGFKEIVGKSLAMREILSIVQRAASSNAAVLVTGESGTGKELIAKALHYGSDRKHKPFVIVNCAALNENLLESELFGHERGSFTGADKQRAGRFETADGGTIFLDEIGDIPLTIQVKLLRVLQEGNFERVGSSVTINTDMRIIAATNKNILQLISFGTFREDLYYRLNVVSIEIPPLRERREDISPLIDFYMNKFSKDNGNIKYELSSEALDYLLKYDYPGNVREMQNILQRAIILTRSNVISKKDVSVEHTEDITQLSKPGLTLSRQLEYIEQELVMAALKESGGNQSQAAKKLGIHESSLRYRLNKWDLK